MKLLPRPSRGPASWVLGRLARPNSRRHGSSIQTAPPTEGSERTVGGPEFAESRPFETEAADTTAAAIAGKTARGGLLLVFRSGGVQVIQLGSTLLIARFVAPGDYGTLAVALAALGFARYCGDLGVSLSFLALPDLNYDTAATGAFAALVLACLETCVLFVLAPVLATVLHGSHHAADIIRVLSVCLVLEALRFGPTVKMDRGLRFGRYGSLALVDTLIQYSTQMGLLVAGLGVWALVLGQIARCSVGTIVFVWKGGGLTMPLPRVPILPLMRRALPYQGPVILTAVGGLMLPLILTIHMSVAGIGYWGWSTVLATPIATLVSIVSGITLPALARLRRTDPDRVDRAADLMMRASVVLPAAGAGLLFGFAHPLIAHVFGGRWTPATVAAEVNLLGVVPGTLSLFLAAVLESAQRARERFVAMLVGQAIALALAAVLPGIFGLGGAAFASAIAFPVIDTVILGWLAKFDFRRAAASGAIAFACPAAITWALAHLITNDVSLVAYGLLSLVPCAVVMWYVDREAARTVLRFGFRLPPRLAARLRVVQPSVAQ